MPECLSVCIVSRRNNHLKEYGRFPVSRHSLYPKDFDVSPVSTSVFKGFFVSPVLRHFWKRLEGSKARRLEG